MPDNASLPRPRWALAPPAPQGVVDALRLPRLWSQLLYNRGIESREMAWDLLHASEAALHDPFLFAEMDVAVARVLTAIEEGEIIAVFGDFDTDGVTASALLYEALLCTGRRRLRPPATPRPRRARAECGGCRRHCGEWSIGHHHSRLRHHLRRGGAPGEAAWHGRHFDRPPRAHGRTARGLRHGHAHQRIPLPVPHRRGIGIQVGAGHSPEAGIACSPGRPGAGIAGDCRGHGSAARRESRHSNAGPREAARDGAPRSARALVGGGRRPRVP